MVWLFLLIAVGVIRKKIPSGKHVLLVIWDTFISSHISVRVLNRGHSLCTHFTEHSMVGDVIYVAVRVSVVVLSSLVAI